MGGAFFLSKDNLLLGFSEDEKNPEPVFKMIQC